MKKISDWAEVILGAIFVFGGINGLLIPLGFEAIIPVNPQSKFAVLLSQTNYIFIVQKIVELLAGVGLLTGRFRLPAILALAPIVICIMLYHLFDDIAHLPMGIMVLICYLVAFSNHRHKMKELINSRNTTCN